MGLGRFWHSRRTATQKSQSILHNKDCDFHFPTSGSMNFGCSITEMMKVKMKMFSILRGIFLSVCYFALYMYSCWSNLFPKFNAPTRMYNLVFRCLLVFCIISSWKVGNHFLHSCSLKSMKTINIVVHSLIWCSFDWKNLDELFGVLVPWKLFDLQGIKAADRLIRSYPSAAIFVFKECLCVNCNTVSGVLLKCSMRRVDSAS